MQKATETNRSKIIEGKKYAEGDPIAVAIGVLALLVVVQGNRFDAHKVTAVLIERTKIESQCKRKWLKTSNCGEIKTERRRGYPFFLG